MHSENLPRAQHFNHSTAAHATTPDASTWAQQVVAFVNARLQALFEEKRAHACRRSPSAHELVDAVAALTMRGGKRLRPLAMYASYRATMPPEAASDWEAIANLGASIELLQSCLLIQDDWMDDDDERRGGPSTHAAFVRKQGDRKLGASLAILASDVALGFAVEMLHATCFPQGRATDAASQYMNMYFEVICGQQLDLLGHDDVTLMHDLKTGSYTARGPILLGALLADASDEQLQALDPFAEPLGLAFQLRDDLLGTFGHPAVTGKPTGHDLRQGKNTALIAAARMLLSNAERKLLDDVFGNREANLTALKSLTCALERCGARRLVEAQLSERLADAKAALIRSEVLMPEGTHMLLELTDRMALRDH